MANNCGGQTIWFDTPLEWLELAVGAGVRPANTSVIYWKEQDNSRDLKNYFHVIIRNKL